MTGPLRPIPRRIEPLIERANLADMQNQLDRAIGLIGKAAVLAPGDPRVLDLQVQFASEKGDWEKVRQLLGPHEIDLDPRTPNGLTYAEALLRLGHPEQARVMFARALLLSPQNPYSRMMLAEAQLATGMRRRPCARSVRFRFAAGRAARAGSGLARGARGGRSDGRYPGCAASIGPAQA
jgi:predicted Zn-dependent protease